MHAAVGPVEQQLQERLVAAALSLPLLSPLATVRSAAESTADVASSSSMQACAAPATAAAAAAAAAAAEAGGHPSSMDAGEAAAAAAASAVGRFLSLSLGLEGTVDIDYRCLQDLHAFCSNSTSAADVALDVQSVCEDFSAAVKEAAAASAEAVEDQQQQHQQQQEQQQEEGAAAAGRAKRKRQLTRQQMQRKFTELRGLLRTHLQLPCLSLCGGDTSLFAAALNDASGLPGPPGAPHPLQDAAALQQHDTAARAAAVLSRGAKNKQPLASWLATEAAKETPKAIGELLGDTWVSAAQQWYLLLQLLLQCQQIAKPHKDVLAQRELLLGFVAALVLHALQQRQRCWEAAAQYQVLADAAAVSLVSPSVTVPAALQQGLQQAAETLQQALQQAGALLPTLTEAAAQNDAIDLAFAAVSSASGSSTSASLAAFEGKGHASTGAQQPAAAAAAAPGGGGAAAGTDERRILRHDVRQLRGAWETLRKAQQQLEVLQQLLLSSPEARRLSAAATAAATAAGGQGEGVCMRVRLQWLGEVKTACEETLAIMKRQGDEGKGDRGLFNLLPTHAAAGLRKACEVLHAQSAAIAAAAAAAQEETANNSSRGDTAVAKATETLQFALAACKGDTPQPAVDLLLQLPSQLNKDNVQQQQQQQKEQQHEQQQPVFASLPVPSLECLFPFKQCTAAVEAFTRAAPACVVHPLLQTPAAAATAAAAGVGAGPAAVSTTGNSSKARDVVLLTLQRAAAVVLAAFDALEGTTRLCLSLLRLTLVLLQLGWGRLSSEEEAAAAAAAARPEKQKDEWIAATGLGEGDGAQDRSEDIKDEFQFDGLRDEQQDTQQQKPPEKPKTQEEVHL